MYKENYKLIFSSFAPVGLEDYVNFFKKNFDDFVYLKLKFPHSKGEISECREYRKGKIVKRKFLYSLPVFNLKNIYFFILPFFYLKCLFQTILPLWSVKNENKETIYFGVNYFCAFCGIILKKIGKVDFVIYRVMDFFPLPPSGVYRYLNRVFYIIDNFCLKNADDVWFTTEGHILGREKYGYYDRVNASYKLIPLGINPDKIISIPVEEENKYSIVYCGVISKYHMLDLVFDAIIELKEKYSNIRLNIIGSGPDEEYFRNLSEKMDVDDVVVWHGFIEEGEKFFKLMSQNVLGIALYRDEENFMKYTEPAKVKYYLNFGVPVVVSLVPLIAYEMNEKGVAFGVKNCKEDIVNTIDSFFGNQSVRDAYKSNIKKYVESLNVFKLLENTLEPTLNQFRKQTNKK